MVRFLIAVITKSTRSLPNMLKFVASCWLSSCTGPKTQRPGKCVCQVCHTDYDTIHAQISHQKFAVFRLNRPSSGMPLAAQLCVESAIFPLAYAKVSAHARKTHPVQLIQPGIPYMLFHANMLKR